MIREGGRHDQGGSEAWSGRERGMVREGVRHDQGGSAAWSGRE